MTGLVTSVNVGGVRQVQAGGRTVETGIWKTPVTGRIAVRGVNLDGDDQADRQVHGGPDKAVYAYGVHDYEWWEQELGRTLEPGTFGENLTIAGMAVSKAVVGERWRIGSAELQVCQPRSPCGKLGIRMGDPHFPRHFARADRPGAYLRIVTEGELGAGDDVIVVHRPPHGLTVAAVNRAVEGETSLLPDLLRAPELAATRVAWAVKAAVDVLQAAPSAESVRRALHHRLVSSGMTEEEAVVAITEAVAQD